MQPKLRGYFPPLSHVNTHNQPEFLQSSNLRDLTLLRCIKKSPPFLGKWGQVGNLWEKVSDKCSKQSYHGVLVFTNGISSRICQDRFNKLMKWIRSNVRNNNDQQASGKVQKLMEELLGMVDGANKRKLSKAVKHKDTVKIVPEASMDKLLGMEIDVTINSATKKKRKRVEDSDDDDSSDLSSLYNPGDSLSSLLKLNKTQISESANRTLEYNKLRLKLLERKLELKKIQWKLEKKKRERKTEEDRKMSLENKRKMRKEELCDMFQKWELEEEERKIIEEENDMRIKERNLEMMNQLEMLNQIEKQRNIIYEESDMIIVKRNLEKLNDLEMLNDLQMVNILSKM